MNTGIWISVACVASFLSFAMGTAERMLDSDSDAFFGRVNTLALIAGIAALMAIVALDAKTSSASAIDLVSGPAYSTENQNHPKLRIVATPRRKAAGE